MIGSTVDDCSILAGSHSRCEIDKTEKVQPHFGCDFDRRHRDGGAVWLMGSRNLQPSTHSEITLEWLIVVCHASCLASVEFCAYLGLLVRTRSCLCEPFLRRTRVNTTVIVGSHCSEIAT